MNSIKKQLSLTFETTTTRPKFKTEPNSRERSAFRLEDSSFALPPIHRTEHKSHRLKTESKYAKSQSTLASESQSDKILNQFLMNYFKKKNRMSPKNMPAKTPHVQAMEPRPARKAKQRAEVKSLLCQNSIDAYFDTTNLIH